MYIPILLQDMIFSYDTIRLNYANGAVEIYPNCSRAWVKIFEMDSMALKCSVPAEILTNGVVGILRIAVRYIRVL